MVREGEFSWREGLPLRPAERIFHPCYPEGVCSSQDLLGRWRDPYSCQASSSQLDPLGNQTWVLLWVDLLPSHLGAYFRSSWGPCRAGKPADLRRTRWEGVPVAVPLAQAGELMLAKDVERNRCFAPSWGAGGEGLLPFSILTEGMQLGETCPFSTKVGAVSPSPSWLAPG